MRNLRKSIEDNVMTYGFYDTKNYRYRIQEFIEGKAIVRIKLEYLDTTEALNPLNWVIVKEF